jgi:hypothetical protein
MSKGKAISPTHLAGQKCSTLRKNQICGLRLLGYDFHLVSQESTNLDLLRSFAVLLVLFDHTIKFLGFYHHRSFDINWMGRIGVTFFFVHTSLVLMLSFRAFKSGGMAPGVEFFSGSFR